MILFRLSGRKIRNNRLFREDKIMALSIVPLLIRISSILSSSDRIMSFFPKISRSAWKKLMLTN